MLSPEESIGALAVGVFALHAYPTHYPETSVQAGREAVRLLMLTDFTEAGPGLLFGSISIIGHDSVLDWTQVWPGAAESDFRAS